MCMTMAPSTLLSMDAYKERDCKDWCRGRPRHFEVGEFPVDVGKQMRQCTESVRLGARGGAKSARMCPGGSCNAVWCLFVFVVVYLS